MVHESKNIDKKNIMGSNCEGTVKLAPQNSEYEITDFQPAIFDAPQSQLMSANPSGKHSEANMAAYQSIGQVKQGSAKNLELEEQNNISMAVFQAQSSSQFVESQKQLVIDNGLDLQEYESYAKTYDNLR